MTTGDTLEEPERKLLAGAMGSVHLLGNSGTGMSTPDGVLSPLPISSVGRGTRCRGADDGSIGGREARFPAHALRHRANGLQGATLAKFEQSNAIPIAAPRDIRCETGFTTRATARVAA